MSERILARAAKLAAVIVLTLAATLILAIGASVASAEVVGPINFESGYTTGNINGQNGWSKTGPYDVEVANVSSFPDASGYGFGVKALRISNAVVSGSFGDQTFAPKLSSPAGEALSATHFEASFKIGTTSASPQPGLYMSVSPDDGNGARMSYLRFEEETDGVHVYFDDVVDPGPVGTVATFNETDIATLSRSGSHTIRFSIDFNPGPANDVVKIYIDGVLKATGTTWEDYYRYDPEQAGGGNVVSPVRTLLFRTGGETNTPSVAGHGFLVDDVSLTSFQPLKLEKIGSGRGTVVSDPAGINCGTACTGETAPFGGLVTLTASADSSSIFKSWSGCVKNKTHGLTIEAATGVHGRKCTVYMEKALTVKAKFEAVNTITLTKAGGGYGTVSSSPAGISCGPTCTTAAALYETSKTVLLKAVPKTGEEFGGWTGCDSVNGEGKCVVAMTSAHSVTAKFE